MALQKIAYRLGVTYNSVQFYLCSLLIDIMNIVVMRKTLETLLLQEANEDLGNSIIMR
jgi:hypothetical protein